MFASERICRFKLHNQSTVNDNVCKILSNQISILISDLKAFLRLYSISRLFQPMLQAILINFLKKAIAKIYMDIIGNLSNFIYQ